jgi:hypothetical protein
MAKRASLGVDRETGEYPARNWSDPPRGGIAPFLRDAAQAKRDGLLPLKPPPMPGRGAR